MPGRESYAKRRVGEAPGVSCYATAATCTRCATRRLQGHRVVFVADQVVAPLALLIRLQVRVLHGQQPDQPLDGRLIYGRDQLVVVRVKEGGQV